MFEPRDPAFVPILMPGDLRVLRRLDEERRFRAATLSASYGANPRLQPLVEEVRGRCDVLLVDPMTAHFQFEGYMSMPDYRALPYSPAQGPLGLLWEPDTFSTPARRRELVHQVAATQQDMGAGATIAPYFLVPAAGAAWLEAAREVAALAVEELDDPVGVAVCVHLDALLEEGGLDAVISAFAPMRPAFFWVAVVDYDEREATPAEVRRVLELASKLAEGGRPVVLAYVGRTGLVSLARGGAAYAAGMHGLETLQRRSLREGMGTRPANSYYLEDLMIHLPVRVAEAALEQRSEWGRSACGCPACRGDERVTMMVSHRLAHHTLLRRLEEVEAMAAVPMHERLESMRGELDTALDRCRTARERLARDAGAEDLSPDHYHYLEVLRETAGGPRASIPGADRPAI